MRILALTPNPAIDKTVLIDRLEPGRVHRTYSVEAVPGGKGNNVARIAKLLGAEVCVGGVLAGHAGRWMEDAYRAEGFAEGVFARAAGETRTCVIMVETKAGRVTVLNEDGPVVSAETAAEFVRLVGGAARGLNWVSVSGSLPPGAGPEHWAPLIGAIRAAGAPVAADCSGAWLRTVAAAGPDLLRINADEAADLTGRPVGNADEARAAAAEIRRLGARAVIISLGGDGAIAANGDGAWRISVPAVEVVSPIGGGDTMLAGVLFALAGGADFPEACRRGASLATAKCLVAGSSKVRMEEYQRLLPLTRLERA